MVNHQPLHLRLDCRFFRAEKPCRFGRLCEGCPHYAPMGCRILVIKLDAIGDVARTTTILHALCERHDPLHITWLVAPAAEELLAGNPSIDVLLPYAAEALERLRVERFDVVLSLDKTARATAAAMNVTAPKKLGFGLSAHGTVFPLNPGAEYAFLLGLSDDLKFRRNARTYQDIIFECCELEFGGEDYCLPLADEERARAQAFWARAQVVENETVIGLNCGGGAAFANKMWGAEQCLEFIRALRQVTRARVALFGAERERPTIEAVKAALPDEVIDTGTDNGLKLFQALLARCDVVVTGDSLGMHLAMAEKRRVVILFGPTCAAEIATYERGEMIVTPLPCAPCYQSSCHNSPTCLEAIDMMDVVAAVGRQLDAATKRS